MATVEHQTIQVRNPATFERISELAVASADEVRTAISRARHAQARWQSTSFPERADCLFRLRDLLLDDADRLADILTAETGRPRAEVYGNELFYLCNAIGTWAKRAEKYLRPKRIKPNFALVKAKKVISTYSPRGVIGIISPWN
ncbi:MAG: aldehyde dehydrogenase family protein, partial [Candidatus Binatia bacterium]